MTIENDTAPHPLVDVEPHPLSAEDGATDRLDEAGSAYDIGDDLSDDTTDDARRTGTRGANSKQIAKRSIEKYLEVADAPEADRRAAALVLGSPSRTDAAEIAVTVIAAPRANLRLLDRTDAIAAATDPFDAMSVVMALEPADIRRTWDLLRELDVVADRWPGSAATAAKTIARAVHNDSASVLAGTARIRCLVRK